MTIEARESSTIAPFADGLSEDRERAQKVAARRRQRRQFVEIAIRIGSLAVVLSIWEIFGARIDPVLFTTPSKIAVAAVGMIGSGELWNYLWPSLVVLLLGLSSAAVIGIAVGLLLARFWVLDVALGVYITFLYSTPSVALVRLIEVGRAFRCSERQLWLNIVLPGALPFIVTGLRLAVGRGLIGMVLADLYTAISGIGYLIVRTASTYQVDKMFVPIVTLGILGVTLTALLRVLEIKVAPWTAAAQGD